jgi:hypothetical protein
VHVPRIGSNDRRVGVSVYLVDNNVEHASGDRIWFRSSGNDRHDGPRRHNGWRV